MSSVPFNPRRALELDRVTVKETSPVFSTLSIIFACIAICGLAGYALAVLS